MTKTSKLDELRALREAQFNAKPRTKPGAKILAGLRDAVTVSRQPVTASQPSVTVSQRPEGAETCQHCQGAGFVVPSPAALRKRRSRKAPV